MELPWRRDVAQIESGLSAWAASFRPGRQVTDVCMPGSGMANDTALFRLGGEALAARLAPLPGSPCPTFPTFDLARQARVIDLVRRRTDVPVPEIVVYEESDLWLGSPFLVSKAIDGVVASDNPLYLIDREGWFLRGGLLDWKRLETTTIDILARIHTVDDLSELGFLWPDAPGETALQRQLGYQSRYYDWARDGIRIDLLEKALDVLEVTMPANDDNVLNWGDSRPGNIIYRQFEPAAVLDWEMATIGPAEVDVAWMTFFQRFFRHFIDQIGLPPVPQMFEPHEVAITYERCSGRSLDDLTWYEAFAGLRFGIILARMSLRNIAFGIQVPPANNDDLMMFAPLLETLLSSL